MIDLDALAPGQREWEGDIGARRALDGRITWYMRFRVGGRRITETIEHVRTKRQAMSALMTRKADIFRGVWQPKTRRVTLAEYAKDFFAAKAELATLEKYKSQWTLHLKRAFGTRTFDEVTIADCERYRRAREIAGAAPATVRNELRCLQSMFAQARKEGLTTADPVAHVSFTIDNRRTRVLTADERKRLVEAAHQRDDYVRPLVLVLLFTGVRISHACRLRWDEFDFGEGVLSSLPDKNSDRVTVPLVPALVDVLRLWQEVCPSSTWVFPSRNDTSKPRSRSGVKSALALVLAEADIYGLWVHDVRRTFVTEVRKRVAGSTAKALTGQSDEMVEHYNVAQIETLRDAVDGLPGARDPAMIPVVRDGHDVVDLADRKKLKKVSK